MATTEEVNGVAALFGLKDGKTKNMLADLMNEWDDMNDKAQAEEDEFDRLRDKVNASPVEKTPLDVWLRLTPQEDDDEEDELAEAEANTFLKNGRYVVEWYLNSVGLVKSVEFDTYEAATAWLTAQGFEDFSS